MKRKTCVGLAGFLAMAVLSGAAHAQTEIYDWHGLYGIWNDMDGNYVLMNDLDEETGGYSDYNSGAG